MHTIANQPIFELIYIIVNYGMGSKVLRKAKEYGDYGGTIYFGKGTVSNAILNFFSVYDERKEIVLIAAAKPMARELLQKLNEELRFDKPNHGIAFTVATCAILGSHKQYAQQCQEKGEEETMYHYIQAVVQKGRAEDVIEAAKAAGSKGGTIVNARGSGVNATAKVFHMDIEPEREVVMILSKTDATEAIVDSIYKQLELDKPGNGIILVQPVSKACGLYEEL